ncbi:hypothetical protein GCM10009799_02480 [Nocardiopsis rhodophaea]|uniref:Uncharacterized protein n=1 Tax=Nocardiopsis rhodophaea TaxID=280238 RepID=A0ABN2S5S0_9ACTN
MVFGFGAVPLIGEFAVAVVHDPLRQRNAPLVEQIHDPGIQRPQSARGERQIEGMPFRRRDPADILPFLIQVDVECILAELDRHKAGNRARTDYRDSEGTAWSPQFNP